MDDTELQELTQPRIVRFWGQEYAITPVLIEQVLGDGRQVIGFQPLNTRPNYYIVRVDSAWALDNERAAPELFLAHFEEVCEAIEEEYGASHWCSEACPLDCKDDQDCQGEGSDWPALSEDAGSGWWAIERSPSRAHTAAWAARASTPPRDYERS